MQRLLTCLFCLTASLAQAEITVFAAASLRGVLEEVNQTAPTNVTVSYASSAALARQIAQGAPADIFFSANKRWVSWLETQSVSQPFETKDFLGNELVLIGSQDTADLDIRDLPDRVQSGFLAIGHDRAVPAGIYAREALTSLRLWDDLDGRLLQTDNVRAALRLVALGEVSYGITYLTDALAEPRVRILHRFAPESHSAIIYSVAQLSARSEASDYLEHLTGEASRAVFRAHGFQDLSP